MNDLEKESFDYSECFRNFDRIPLILADDIVSDISLLDLGRH